MSSIQVSVSTQKPGAALPADAVGLSYETAVLLPDTNGVHYFRPDNASLVQTFKSLGVRSLRIGGNSVDAATIPIPSEADVDAFFDFAKAAGVKVIYSVRLKDGDPQSAARVVKQIRQRHADALESYAIGNEPDYYKDYDVYRPRWVAIRDAILAVDPDARFCGPDQNPSPQLCRKMVAEFGDAKGRLVQITQHSYPFGCSYKNPQDGKDSSKLIAVDAAAAREKMLAPDAYAIYQKTLHGMIESVAGSAVTYRMTEVNSYWFSGLQGASDSYAAALWGADYLHWWAARGSGLNFHTGDRTGGDIALPCRYAAFVSAHNGYEVRPLGYGMKLFDLGGHGRQLPVTLSAASDLVAYATLGEGRTISVTIINKSHGPAGHTADVQLQFDAPLAGAGKCIFLRATNDDLAAGSSDVTLGGAPIEPTGQWRGRWGDLPASSITMPPASAAVVRMTLG